MRTTWIVVCVLAVISCSDGENSEPGDSNGDDTGPVGEGGMDSMAPGDDPDADDDTMGGGPSDPMDDDAPMDDDTGGPSDAVRGAISLNVLAPEGCPLEERFYDYPEVEGGHPVTATDKSGLIADGSTTPGGAQLATFCRWIGSAPGYGFVGDVDIAEGKTLRTVQIGWTPTSDETKAGTILFQQPQFDSSYRSREVPCLFTVTGFDESSWSVWGEFHCDAVSGDDLDAVCAIGDSYFAFEHCTPPQ